MTTLKILSAAGLIAAIMWLLYEPSFEPTVAALGALTALIALFVGRRKNDTSSQMQSVSDSSTGIQAGGNVHIGTTDKRDKND